ncbi:MAG TPA: hypothetical protein VGT04_14940 [Acidobacteriaceae bacterium]|nr:hypothetical protein [Acidobacteriaceae bacterium]
MNWWQRFRRSNAHTQANIVCTFLMMIATIVYAGTAYRQLCVMRKTLAEMKESEEQTSEQSSSAIGNINWMARSMDWSQKSTKRAMDEQVDKLQLQTSQIKRSADAAKSASETAKETLIASNRPWVTADVRLIGGLRFSMAPLSPKFNIP